jgi:ATP-dependent Lhr-like helicase
VPSLFSHEIPERESVRLPDDAPLEERRARAVSMRRGPAESVLTEVGRLDPNAIAEVCEQAWPDVRTATTWHDALMTLVLLPATSQAIEGWRHTSTSWCARSAARPRSRRGGSRILDRGRAREGPRACSGLRRPFRPPCRMSNLRHRQNPTRWLALVQGWLSHIGPIDATSLRAGPRVVNRRRRRSGLPPAGGAGWALRGVFHPRRSDVHRANRIRHFTSGANRRLLARIHRLTLGTLRREIAPVTSGRLSCAGCSTGST